MTSLASINYVDPVLSVGFDPKSLSELTRQFPPYYSKITQQCSTALKTYKQLLSLQYQTNSWEFATLKASVNLNFNSANTNSRTFDIKIAKKVLERCNSIDDEISSKYTIKVSHLINFIKNLTVEEYISDPGTLLLKVYFKLLSLKNSLVEQLNIAYTKAKLLIINYELCQIMEMIDAEDNPVALDNTDFQSTLISYRDFVSVLIDQLDQAVADKDSEQIEECLGILNDVEKMYESVRMNFFFTEEFNEWEQEQLLLQSASTYTESSGSSPNTEDLSESYQMSRFLNEKPSTPLHHKHSRRGSVSSTTSSMGTFSSGRQTTTISEELPYLMQAFDEARVLEKELSTYQNQSPLPQKKVTRSPSVRTKLNPSIGASTIGTTFSRPGVASSVSSMTIGSLSNNNNEKNNLQSGISTPNMGFQSNLLNSIYGLHPASSTPFAPSHLHNEVD